MTPTFKALTPAGEWVEGYYFFNNEVHGIMNSKLFSGTWVQVIPETVCMSTPIKDRNNKIVFVGDEIVDEWTSIKHIVKLGYCKEYDFTGFYAESKDGKQSAINHNYNEFITLTGKNIYNL